MSQTGISHQDDIILFFTYYRIRYSLFHKAMCAYFKVSLRIFLAKKSPVTLEVTMQLEEMSHNILIPSI